MGSYNGLVDMNGHPQVGGKTVLYLIDGLYATQHNEFRLPPVCKWQSAPFNGHWTSSLFASQDGVAIDSVALDFLRNEPTLTSHRHRRGGQLPPRDGAGPPPPSKTVYDPAKTGKTLASLGVHEHWNNATDKKYSRNLGKAHRHRTNPRKARLVLTLVILAQGVGISVVVLLVGAGSAVPQTRA